MKEVRPALAALAILTLPIDAFAQATATPGKALNMVLLPKFLGNVQSDRPRHRIADLFDQAHEGAEQAAKELQNPSPLSGSSGRPPKTVSLDRSRSSPRPPPRASMQS
jgi:hypothetical protein